MTDDISCKDNKLTKRNKNTNAKGEEYDKRKGSFTAIDRVFMNEGMLLNDWLTPEICEAELSVLNKDGKDGPKYKFPPSLIFYLLLLKEYSDLSYRRIMGDKCIQLGLKSLPVPSYSTLHKSEYKFFMTDLGRTVIEEADEILKKNGIRRAFDPLMLTSTDIHPEIAAPQRIVTCQKELEEQQARDLKAKKISELMKVHVLKPAVDDKRAHVCALDGSGEGISGPGIYVEHVWNINSRAFIKQHALIDVETQEPLAFSITLEKPGDSPMLPHILRGAEAAELEISKLLADSAYDNVNNWKVTAEMNIEFCPNLKEAFKKRCDLPKRNEMLEREKEIGKTQYHIETGYNVRWLVEAFFSMLKKMYGEKLRSKLFSRMVETMKRRYCLCSLHKRMYYEARAEAC